MKWGRHSLESPTVPAQEQQYRGEPMPVKNDFAMVPTVIAGTPATMLPRKEMTIQDLWGVLSRRRGIILGALLLTIGLAAAFFATATRLYKGAAEIQIQKETADTLGMDTMMGQGTQSDAVDANITLQTQAQILQSDTLAVQVVKELNLEQSADFRGHFSPIGWVLGLFAPASTPEPTTTPWDERPGRRTQVVTTFQSHLKVVPVSGTRLIDIEYLSTDPHTAAAVVNQLVHDLSEYNFETRHNATREASIWLGDQLSELRKHSDELQAKVVDLQHNSGVFAFGQTDGQGHDQVFTPALDQLQQATTQLEQAQSARIMKGALYQVVKNGDPENISGLAGNGMLAGAGVSGSLALLQTLRSEEAQTQARLNELSAKFGPGYPKLAELQSSLNSTQKSIHDEAARIAARVQNDYMVAQQIEDKDRAVYLDEKTQAESQNDKAVQYQIARQEATQSRTLYESLVGRMKEADVVAGMRSSNITLVDAARVPARPAKPSALKYAAASIVGGLLFGICGALLRDATDNSIQELGELELLFAEASIGILPFHDPKAEKRRLARARTPVLASAFAAPLDAPSPATAHSNATVAASQPRAAYTEALRVLCTSLMQGSSNGGPRGQVILVTSSVSGEGKSMLSTNLAIVCAQRGKRVLLVDGDLRTGVLHRDLNLRDVKGLSTLLSAENNDDAVLSPEVPFPRIPSLSVLPAGPLPSYPAELLASDRMAELMRLWRDNYDYILIDGAPILPVTDSALLSRYADFTLVVVRHNITDRRSLERTCNILRSQGVRQLGMVLNGVKASGGAQYKYYGYKQMSYNGSHLHA
jgi:succinoglycan biosynthesis transport protein ExoP